MASIERSQQITLESPSTAVDSEIATVSKLDGFYSDFYKSLKTENLKIPSVKRAQVIKLKSSKEVGLLSPLLLSVSNLQWFKK